MNCFDIFFLMSVDHFAVDCKRTVLEIAQYQKIEPHLIIKVQWYSSYRSKSSAFFYLTPLDCVLFSFYLLLFAGILCVELWTVIFILMLLASLFPAAPDFHGPPCSRIGVHAEQSARRGTLKRFSPSFKADCGAQWPPVIDPV